MNKKIIAAASVASVLGALTPSAAMAAPGNGNGSANNNANPSCAALYAQIKNAIGLPSLGQVNQLAPGFAQWVATQHIADNGCYGA